MEREFLRTISYRFIIFSFQYSFSLSKNQKKTLPIKLIWTKFTTMKKNLTALHSNQTKFLFRYVVVGNLDQNFEKPLKSFIKCCKCMSIYIEPQWNIGISVLAPFQNFCFWVISLWLQVQFFDKIPIIFYLQNFSVLHENKFCCRCNVMME